MYAKPMSINNNLMDCKFIRSKKTKKMALKMRLFVYHSSIPSNNRNFKNAFF